MSIRIRFEHKQRDRFHIITSPDLKGLCAIGETLEAAEEEALALVKVIEELDGPALVVSAIELEAAA